jgi:hypothetical protein
MRERSLKEVFYWESFHIWYDYRMRNIYVIYNLL